MLDFFKIHARHNYYGDLVIPNGADLIETLIVTKCFAYTFPDLKKRYIRLIQTSCQDNCDIKELAKYLGETLVDSIILGTELRDELKAVGRHVTSRVWDKCRLWLDLRMYLSCLCGIWKKQLEE